MRNYAICAKITAPLTIFGFVLSLVCHYCFKGIDAEFWCNVSLAIFGSGLLTFISSITGYMYEKRRNMEGFVYTTRTLLKKINQYSRSWSDEKKIDFFLEYAEMDKSLWDSQLGDMYFLWDIGRKKFRYISEHIYSPLQKFNEAVAKRNTNFRIHKEVGSHGLDKNAMSIFIGEMEPMIIGERPMKLTTDEGRVIATAYEMNIMVNNIMDELGGRYYNLMYGKKEKRPKDTDQKCEPGD